MRKLRCLLMMLAVAVVALSCEKEPVAPSVDPVSSGESSGQPENDVEITEFLGLWTRSVNYDESYHYFATHSNWEWRFYENGRSRRWLGAYNDDVMVSADSSIFLYKVEDGKLYLQYYSEEDWTAWDYSIEGDTLTLSLEDEGETTVLTFVKTEDADDKLVGDWSAIDRQGLNGELIERHYQFVTPTYGFVYEITYNSTGTASLGERILGDFRYTIDGNRLSLFDGFWGNFTFRVEGTKLYLSSYGGDEVMYSNFKAENGIPFIP